MMTKKITSILMFAIVALFALTFVSAADVTLTQSIISDTINVTTSVPNANSATVTAITDNSGDSIIPQLNVLNGILTITQSSSIDYEDLDNRAYTATINVSNATGAYKTYSFQYVNSLCDEGEADINDLTLTVELNNKGDGEDDEWFLLDVVEIEVELDNGKDRDLDNVMFEFALIDSSGTDVADDLIWISDDDEQVKVGDIKDGKDEKFTFEFKVSNEVDEDDYTLMIKAYEKGNESELCMDSFGGEYFQDIKVERESDSDRQIVFDNIVLDPTSVPCGQEVTLTTEAFNIGSDGDQEAVKIFLYNKDLNVDYSRVIEDFDADESYVIDFSFIVPKNISEDVYTLKLWSRYTYDEDEDDDGEFPNEAFDDESDVENIKLTTETMCLGSIETSVTIDAALSEDTPKAVIGRQVVIETTIENTGNAEATYKIEISGASSWADVATIDPEEVTIEAGEEETVTIYLDIDADAEAEEKEFTIKATANGQTKEQKVALTLEKGLAATIVTDHLKDNWFIYLIILVNVILIVAIIIIVVRMVSNRSA